MADALAVTLAAAVVAWLGFRPTGPIKTAEGLVFETESAFNYIQVLDLGVERQLRLNEGEGIHSVYRPAGGLADGIWDYFLLAPAFNPAGYGPEQVGCVAIVGLAAGTMAQLFTEAYGPIPIDGAELDPEIIATGRAWFAMDQPNLNAYAVDGRRFLVNAPARYDVVAVDAYRPPYIPFHLTTVEFFQLARDRLNPQGVVAVNVGRTSDDYSLVHAIAATMLRAFPSVYVMDEPSERERPGQHPRRRHEPVHNVERPAREPARVHASAAVGSRVSRRAAGAARRAAPARPSSLMTAPVEQVIHGLVLRYMFEE